MVNWSELSIVAEQDKTKACKAPIDKVKARSRWVRRAI